MKLTSKNLYSYCDNNPVSKTDLNGEIAIAAIAVNMARNISLNLGTYILSSAIMKEKITGIGIAEAVITGAFGGFLDKYEKLEKCKAVISVVFDCVAAAVTCGIETGNMAYAIFTAMATGALALGSISGMAKLLELEDYIPEVEKYLLEFYTGTAHNTILGYVIPDDTPEIHYKRVAGEWFPIA